MIGHKVRMAIYVRKGGDIVEYCIGIGGRDWMQAGCGYS